MTSLLTQAAGDGLGVGSANRSALDQHDPLPVVVSKNEPGSERTDRNPGGHCNGRMPAHEVARAVRAILQRGAA